MHGSDSASLARVLAVVSASQRRHQRHPPPPPPPAGAARPFVLLTFAQSLDGALAAAPGARTEISSAATRRMTHALRAMHDAVLVGVNTVVVDDPRLTARDVPPEVREAARGQPRPVVMDSSGEAMPETTRLESPIVLTTRGGDVAARRRGAGAGAVQYVECRADGDGRVEWAHALEQLRAECGIETVMVEGGNRIITSLCRAPGRPIDCVVVTVSATQLGHAAVHLDAILPPLNDATIEWIPFGRDVVLVASPS